MNFIICDDNEKIRSHVAQMVDKIMMRNKIDYKNYVFDDYNEQFYNIINDDMSNKVYILDIETPSASGIDIARDIRENDIDSIIIFLTGHSELGSDLLQDEIMFLTFIPKLNNMDKRLESAIKKSIKMTGVRQAIRFETGGIVYTIPLDDILYITTDQIDRKSVIITTYNEFRLNRTLQELKKMLNDNFIQTHRACFVNLNKVVSIDKRNNVITFINNTKITLLSENYKKGLKKYGGRNTKLSSSCH